MTKMSAIAEPTHKLTAGYLHAPEHSALVQFETGAETPRSFTILIASDVLDASEGDPANGIAIIDNDLQRVVCDGLYPQATMAHGASRDQRMAFGVLQSIGWREFSYYCRSRPTYRPGIPDMDVATFVPMEGNRQAQIVIGALNPDERDNRDAFIRNIDASPELPYSFPRASRDAMIAEILSHETYRPARNGKELLAWDIRMNFRWNASGVVEGGADVDAAYDKRWSAAVADDPQIFERVCENAVSVYVSSPFSAFEREDRALADLDIAGGNGGFMVLKGIAGRPLEFNGLSDLHEQLGAFSDGEIMDLWVCLRTLDVDLSRKNRAFDVEMGMHEERLALEQEWMNEIDDEVSFDV